jgi:hypothetical protein
MIVDINLFKPEKMNIHDLYEVNENIYKIDISIDKLKPFMLKLNDLNVMSFTEKMLSLSLKTKEDIKKSFDNIDSYIVNEIQERKITKKLKTKFNYRQLTSSYVNKDVSYDILTLLIDLESDKYKTEIYERMNKRINKDDAFIILKDNAKVDLVLEITGIIFDKKEGYIYLENIVRQMKVKKIKPKRIEKLEYSFIDTESDDESDDESDAKSDVKSDTESETNDDCLVDTYKMLLDENENLHTELNTEKELSSITSEIDSD